MDFRYAMLEKKKIGKRIKYACKASNLSVKELQRDLYVGAFQSVYAWMNGNSIPDIEKLWNLACMLNVSMEFLLVGQCKTVKEAVMSQKIRLIKYVELWKEAA